MSTNQTWTDGGLGDTSGWTKPTKVQINDSDIQLPIDLQSHNLSDAEALPIKAVGPFITEQVLATALVVLANTEAPGINVDVPDAVKVVIGVIADASHTYQVQSYWRSAGGTDGFADALASRDTLLTSTAGQKRLSTPLEVRAPQLSIFIKNADATLQHTYKIYLFRMRS